MNFEDLVKHLEKEKEEFYEQVEEYQAKFAALERTYPYRVDVTKGNTTLPVFFETEAELRVFKEELGDMIKDKLLKFERVKLAEQIVKGTPFSDIYIPMTDLITKVEVFGLYD